MRPVLSLCRMTTLSRVGAHPLPKAARCFSSAEKKSDGGSPRKKRGAGAAGRIGYGEGNNPNEQHAGYGRKGIRSRSNGIRHMSGSTESLSMSKRSVLMRKKSRMPAEYPHPGETDDYDELPTYPPRPSFKGFENALKLRSQVVVFDGCPDDPYRPSSTPLYQTSTFRSPSSSAFGAYDYTRSGNPTRTALEKQVAMLEGAAVAFAFTSGMSALAMVTRCATGGSVICCQDIYGGMYRLMTKVASMQGIQTHFVDTTDLKAVEQFLEENTSQYEKGDPKRVKVCHVESPSNPLLRITDIQGLSKLCKKRGVLLTVDATSMSPMLMRPLELGADIVIHSATKYLAGHADTMCGIVAVSDEELAKQIAFHQNAEGTALAPFDCWLTLRGIKTLAIRMERSLKNAQKVAQFLCRHDRVKKLHWTHNSVLVEPTVELGLSKEQEELHWRQARGSGTLICFETGDVNFSRRFMDACRIFKITVSFGSVNSLCELPVSMSHASIPHTDNNVPLLPLDLIRLSIGIEDAQDLLDDLRQAFDVAAAFTAKSGSPLGEDQSSVRELLRGPRTPEAEKALEDAVPGLFKDAEENLLFDSKFEDLPVTPRPPNAADEDDIDPNANGKK